jgi:hypothetical protein
MGRKKYEDEKKKVKRSISVEPEILQFLKSNCINVSSLINKLLKEHIKNAKENTRRT